MKPLAILKRLFAPPLDPELAALREQIARRIRNGRGSFAFCEECKAWADVRPYGCKDDNGRRALLCFDCAAKDPKERHEAMIDRFFGP